uniref:Uncharacterized protein n=1 Tax=Gorilla gorilla gorilla TaxID=9595 RepID=G3SIL8_GORGO
MLQMNKDLPALVFEKRWLKERNSPSHSANKCPFKHHRCLVKKTGRMSCTMWITFSSKLQQSEERNYWKPPSNALFSHQLGAHGRIIGRLGGGSVCNNLLSNVCVSLPCCMNNSEGSHLLNTCVLKSGFFFLSRTMTRS